MEKEYQEKVANVWKRIYFTKREKVPEKVVKLVNCNNCKYKCSKNITKDRGEEYLNYFGRLNRM
jgi:hypothetical protein